MRSKMAFLMVASLLVSLGSMAGGQAKADGLPQATKLAFEGYQIHFTEALGEASRFDRSDAGLSRLAGLLTGLGAETRTLEWRDRISPDIDLIIIAGPAGSFRAEYIARLWVYMSQGGRVLLLADPDPQSDRPSFPANAGLFDLTWNDMGFRAREDIVVVEGPTRLVQLLPQLDETGEVVETPTAPVERPTVITEIIAKNLNATHPITAGIDSELAFFGVRSLELDRASLEFQVEPLAFSDNNAYGEVEVEVYADGYGGAYDVNTDIQQGLLPLAVAFEMPSIGTRLVLIGDRDFAINGGGLQISSDYNLSFLYPGNAQFMLNAIAWLLEVDPPAMTFKSPIVTPSAEPTMTPVSTNQD